MFRTRQFIFGKTVKKVRMNITARIVTRGGLCEHLNHPLDPKTCMQFTDQLRELVAFHDEIHCLELLKLWKLIKMTYF